jgi:hypothetical protein
MQTGFCGTVLEGKRQVGTSKRRWRNNVSKEVGGGGVNWINVARNMNKWRVVVKAVTNLHLS